MIVYDLFFFIYKKSPYGTLNIQTGGGLAWYQSSHVITLKMKDKYIYHVANYSLTVVCMRRFVLKVLKMCKASVTVSQSGLTQAVRDSKITLEQAEYEFLSFIRQHTPPGQCPLAGE